MTGRHEFAGAFVDFLEASPDIVYRLDHAGRIVQVNGALTRLLGYTPAQIAAEGFDFVSLVHPDDYDRVALELRLVRAGRSSKDFEVRLRPRDGGDHVWFSNVTFPLRDAAGEVLGYGGIARDVTRTVRTAASLARRNFELISINSISLSVQGAPDVESRVRNFTAALSRSLELDGACAFFRVTAFPGGPRLVIDEADLGLAELSAAPGPSACRAERIEIFRADGPAPFPCPVAPRAHAAGFRALLFMPLSVGDLGEGAAFFLSRDPEGFDSLSSTLLSTARAQLTVSLESAIRHLIEARKVRIITILKETSSALINAGCVDDLLTVTHFQARRYLTLDRLVISFMTGKETAAVHASAASPSVPRDGGIFRLDDPTYPFRDSLALRDMRYLPDLAATPDAPHAVSYRAAGMRTLLDVPLPLTPELNGCVRFLSRETDAFHPEEREFLRDLARIVALAVANLRLKDELKRQTELAEAKNAELQTFIYSVSHDLKTPLFSILGLAGILKEEMAEDDPRRGYLNRLLENTARMDAQIKELVTLSKIGTYVPVPEPIPLAELVEVALRALDVKIRERSARVTVGAALPAVVADRALLGRVVENLLDNAVKYVPAGRVPEIAVTGGISPGGGGVRITVADNGCGIAERDRERVFALFSRLKVLPDVDGTGAGLSIVRRMVERLGGSISLESEVGAGSRFHVDLPSAAA